MSETDVDFDAALSLDALRRQDEACRRFEEALKNGPASIVDFLGDTSETERFALECELICLEIDYCRRRGETVNADDYVARYPHLQSALRARWSSAETLEAVASPAPSKNFDADYEILHPLGSGTFGEVFKAMQNRAGRIVALKRLRAAFGATDADVERFRREAQAVASLDHPNIVPIYHVGERFFTMKFLPGGALDKIVDVGPVESRQAAHWLIAISRAVQYAHDRGILHRDLKPGNILLDDKGQPHVADFGLARRLDGESSQSASGLVVGTPSYMSPEQAEGSSKNLTTAADVYGLGAILYALLTGRPPFKGPTVADTIQQVLTQRPAPPRLLNSKVDRDLETICLKCLERNPADRYGSAAELAADLERYLAKEPIVARAPSWVEAIGRQIEQRYFIDPPTWLSISLWLIVNTCLAHGLVYVIIKTQQPAFVFWLMYVLANSASAFVFWYHVSRRPTRLTPSERHLIVLTIARQLATATLWFASGAPTDERLFELYPFIAALYGVFTFVEGSLYWGHFYVISLAWFGLVFVMHLNLEWSPLELSLLFATSHAYFAWYVRRVQPLDNS